MNKNNQDHKILFELPSKVRNNNAKFGTLYFYIMQGILIGIYSSNLEVFRRVLNLSDFTTGLVGSFVAIGYCIAAPTSASISSYIGSKLTALISSQMYSIALGVVGICGNIHTSNAYYLAFSLFLFGFCLGIMDIAANSQGILVEICSNESLFGLFHGSYALAVAMGTVIGGFTLYFTGDEGSLYLCIISGIIVGALAYPCSRPYLYNVEYEHGIEIRKNISNNNNNNNNNNNSNINNN